MESYEKVLIEWTSVKDNFVFNEGVEPQNTDLFKLVIKKYASTLAQAFIDSRLSTSTDLDNVIRAISSFGGS